MRSRTELDLVESMEILVVHQKLSKHVVELNGFQTFIHNWSLSSINDEVSSVFGPFSSPVSLCDFMSCSLSELIGIINSWEMLISDQFCTFLLLLSLGGLSLIWDLRNHIKVQRMSRWTFLLHSAENITNTREVELFNLFRVEKTNILNGKTKKRITLDLVNINTISVRIIWELFLTWFQLLSESGVDSNLSLVWLKDDVMELVNFSVYHDLLVWDLVLVDYFGFKEFNTIFGGLFNNEFVHDSNVVTLWM